MRYWRLLTLLFLSGFSASGQTQSDSLEIITKEASIEEIYISNIKLSPEEIEARRQYQILKNRVYRTYPYAKTGSERLEELNQSLARLKTRRERKKFLKITQEYMEREFEARLKKLSRKDGQILVKLIHRQTGKTTFDLVKDLKSGWSAFWYGKTAQLFDINLKTKFRPFEIQEDFWIEDILLEAFERRLLPEQKPKEPIDYVALKHFWNQKQKEVSTPKP